MPIKSVADAGFSLDHTLSHAITSGFNWSLKVIFHIFCHLSTFIEKFIKEYHQSVKQYGSRSGQTVSKGKQQITSRSILKRIKFILRIIYQAPRL